MKLELQPAMRTRHILSMTKSVEDHTKRYGANIVPRRSGGNEESERELDNEREMEGEQQK